MEQIPIICQKDLLLIPFPFSDQSGRKVRPVIVVSDDEFNKSSDDVIVVGVTSNFLKDRYTLSLKDSDLDEGKLISNCYIKPENILKIDKELIVKKIGKITNKTLKLVLNKIREILS